MRLRRLVLPLVASASLALLVYLLYDTPTLHERRSRSEDKPDIQLPRQNTEQKPIRKVVVLGLAHSGSSLVGDIVSHSADVFYVSEPLRALQEKEQKRDVMKARNIIHSFLSCRFRDFDLSDINFSSKDYHSTNGGFLRCLPTDIDDEACLRRLAHHCKKTGIKVLNVVQLPVTDLIPSLMEFPDLAVLLVVKDPRQSLWYRTQELGPDLADDRDSFVQSQCNTLDDNVNAAAVLLHRYRDRVKVLHFESLAKNPVAVSRALYSFLDLKWSASIEKLVQDQISADAAQRKRSPAKKSQALPFKVPTRRPSYKIPTKRPQFQAPSKQSPPVNVPQKVHGMFDFFIPMVTPPRLNNRRQASRSPEARKGRKLEPSSSVGSPDWQFVKLAQEKCFGVMRQLGYPLFRLQRDFDDDAASQRAFDRADGVLDDALLLPV